MTGRSYLLTILAILCVVFAMSGCDGGGMEEERMKITYITVTLTVDGEIQTDDPWTTGATAVNEWAKPIYRVWFDMNGNPDDGAYGNGSGSRQAEIWLDTGRLGFKWDGTHGGESIGEEVEDWPLIDEVTEYEKKANDIKAVITNIGRSLKVTLPLVKIGDPQTLEVSAMCSPWTTSASDNLGPGSGANSWIVISDTSQSDSYTEDDEAGDNGWPELSPNRQKNFDLTSLEVTIARY